MRACRRIAIAVCVGVMLAACGSESDVSPDRRQSLDREAQSAARNALIAAKTIFTDNESYLEATSAELGQLEPSLSFVEGESSADPETVSIERVSEMAFRAAVLSESGTCFGIRDRLDGTGTMYADGDVGECSADAFEDSDYSSDGWSTP